MERTPDTRSTRLHGLDGLRGLAGVGVVLVHVWMYTGGNRPAAHPVVDAVIGELRLGLMAFFVLSAYLLTRPWIAAARSGRPRPATRAFLVRRAARIMPAWWVAIVGAFAVLWRTGSGRAAAPADLPIFAVMAQNHFWHTRGRLIPPGWSLAVEVTFYLLLPLLGWLLVRAARRRGPARPALAIAVTLIAAGLAWEWAAYAGAWPPTVTTSLPTFLPIFACGIAAAALPAPRGPRTRWGMLAAGWALVLACAWWHHDGTGALGHVVRDLPAAMGFALIVPALASGGRGLLELPPVRWLGTVSYGTYLWHMPVLFALFTSGVLPSVPAVAFAAVFGPALVLAALSWYGVERPVLRLASRRARRGRTPARAPRARAQTAP